jgi:hypothetical protein
MKKGFFMRLGFGVLLSAVVGILGGTAFGADTADDVHSF